MSAKSVGFGIETAPEWSVTAQNRDWLKTLRPWTQLIGFEHGGYGIPSVLDWDARVAANIRYFLSNYLVIVVVVLAFNVLTHPWVILACAAAGAALFYASREVSRRNLSLEVGGFRLGAGHLNLAVVTAVSVVLLVLVGEIIFTFIGASSCAVGMHAFLRRSRQAEAAMEAVIRSRIGQSTVPAGAGAASAPMTPSGKESVPDRGAPSAEPEGDDAYEPEREPLHGARGAESPTDAHAGDPTSTAGPSYQRAGRGGEGLDMASV